MSSLLKHRRTGWVLFCGLVALGSVATISAQDLETPLDTQDVPNPVPEKARVLLDQIKKSELDRQVAFKQTEIDRLKEDQISAERDSAALQKTIDSTTSLINDSGEAVNKLVTESRRLEHELSVTEARSVAEKLKVEGLRALSFAQTKTLGALARHGEEAAARVRVRTVEMELLQLGKPIPPDVRDDKAQDELAKARRALTVAEAKTAEEEKAARAAMADAATKMAAAEVRATSAQRLADNDLTFMAPIAERVKPKPAEKKEFDAAARKPQPVKSAPSATATPRPTNAAATIRTKPLFPPLAR